jgi:hypothetical protein
MADDVSFSSLWSNATGFSWEQIARHFATQLSLLEQVHGVTRDALKEKIERMYNNYYFDRHGKSTHTLYNPYAISMLMATGEFKPYFFESGGSSILLSGAMSKDIMKQIVASDFSYLVETTKIESWRFDPEAQSLDEQQTCLLLHAAGFLTLSREHASASSQRLVIPNNDIRTSLIDIVIRHAFSFNIDSARKFILEGRFIDFLDVLRNRVFEIADATAPRNNNNEVHARERHIQDAFSEVLLILSKGRELFSFYMEPAANAGGARKFSDILIRPPTGRLIVFEIGISENRAVHTTQLRRELEQMHTDGHLKVAGKHAAGRDVAAFAAIFTRDGTLKCAAGPFRGKVVDGKIVDDDSKLTTAIENLNSASPNLANVCGYRAW